MSYSKWTSLALSLALVGATACGDDDGEAKPTTGKDGGGITFTDDADVDDQKDSGGGSEEDPDGGGSEEDPDGGVGQDPDSGEPINCDDPSGCYACKPSTNAQFLNACVNSARGIDQLTFDNVERIPGFNPADPFPAF